jgi:hypothetical protein
VSDPKFSANAHSGVFLLADFIGIALVLIFGLSAIAVSLVSDALPHCEVSFQACALRPIGLKAHAFSFSSSAWLEFATTTLPATGFAMARS